MIVWITHVKVGHRQTSIPKTPQVITWGVFTLYLRNLAGLKLNCLLRECALRAVMNHASVELNAMAFGR